MPLRAIAERAGVTAGLVTHHFGTKEGLVAEVDALVIAQCSAALERALAKADPELGGGSAVLGVAQEISRTLRESQELRGYLGHRLVSETEAGRQLFRQFVAVVSEGLQRLRDNGLVRDDVDPVGAMVLVVHLILGPIVLAPQWTDLTGIDSFDASLVGPAEVVTLQVLQHGLFSDEPRR
jgi:AcrR family transcriptional regulator